MKLLKFINKKYIIFFFIFIFLAIIKLHEYERWPGPAHLFGDSRDGVLPSAHTRVPSVLISLLTMALVFYIAQKFFNYWVGILATVFYGTSPIIVFGSRLSVPE